MSRILKFVVLSKKWSKFFGVCQNNSLKSRKIHFWRAFDKQNMIPKYYENLSSHTWIKKLSTWLQIPIKGQKRPSLQKIGLYLWIFKLWIRTSIKPSYLETQAKVAWFCSVSTVTDTELGLGHPSTWQIVAKFFPKNLAHQKPRGNLL